MTLPIPTLNAFQLGERYTVTRAAPRKRQPRKPAPRVSVVGYMRTIQADRRDAEIMLRYAMATQRERNLNPEE